MTELLDLFAPLGVGGILAGVIFYFHRQDTNRWLTVERGRADTLLRALQANTEALTALRVQLEDGREEE